MANLRHIEKIVGEVFDQAVGKVPTRSGDGTTDGRVDYSKIVEIGKTLSDSEVEDFRNDYITGLMSRFVKDIYTQKEYTGGIDSPWYRDSAEFGAIMQAITITAPKVIPNSARTPIESGVTTAGTWTVYLADTTVDVFSKQSDWALPVSIPGMRLATAFSNAGELESFTNAIFLACRNAINLHIEDLDNANRNNFVLERLANASGKGIFNVCELYYKESGDQDVVESGVVKYEKCMNSPKFWLFFSETARLVKDYMKKMSTLFTITTPRFVADDDLVIQCLSIVNEKCNTIAMSDIYNREIVSLPNFQSVAYWQGIGETFKSFADCGKITGYVDVNGTSTEKTINNLAMIVADSRCCIHTVVSRRVGHMYDSFKDVNSYEWQFVDSMKNLLDLPFCALTINDYTIA